MKKIQLLFLSGLLCATSLNAQVAAPATVTLSPRDTAVCVGVPLTLTAVAVNSDSVVWFRNYARISHGTSLVRSAVIMADSGLYMVVAYNRYGCDTARAVVRVVPPLLIVMALPSTVAVYEGDALTLTFEVENAVSHRWFKNDVLLSVSTSSIELVGITSADAGTYVAQAYNGGGMVSDTVEVEVVPLSATAVTSVFEANLSIYPNPFVRALHLTGAEGCTLRVADQSGAVVHMQKVASSEEIVQLEHLPSGVYFLRIEKEGQVKTLKAVKK